MNVRFGITGRSRRNLMWWLAVWVLAVSAVSEARAQEGELKVIVLKEAALIDEQDTLLAGAYRVENEERLTALGMELFELSNRRLSESEAKELAELEKLLAESSASSGTSNPKAAEEMQMIKDKIASVEKATDSELAYQAKVRKMSVAEYRSKQLEALRKMLTSYEQVSSKASVSGAEAQAKKMYDLLKQKQAASAGIIPKMYAVKRRMAALMVDGKLHNYVEIHDFRHGRAAVAIRERFYSKGQGVWTHRNVWGFVDERMRLVIPCQYARVFDFNNYKNYRSKGVFEEFFDRDDRPWTTVFTLESGGGMMGMIDRDGKEMIPSKFISSEQHHEWIEFIKTPWGEYAIVTIMKGQREYVEGIIDRSGNYTLEPAYKHLVYYDDLQCFGTTGDDRIYFDHKGNRLSK